jgi:RimJ/RimL family protein N-acetyltransferase
MIDYGFGIALGPISDADPVKLRKWRNMPAIYKWCRQCEPLNSWDHQAWLESLPKSPDIRMYTVLNTENEIVGVCGLTDIDYINRRAEFSLYIGTEFQGKKFGLYALKTLCAHGFMVLGLHHIFGETFDGNPAAKTFEDIGFKKEGTRRGFYYREGKFIDAHLYSLLNKEFREKWKI